MTVVNATLCLPFQQAQEVIEIWEQSVCEACRRTSFPYEEEVAEVLSQIKDTLPSFLYARLLESISVDFGDAKVQYALRYDATPEEEDELALDILEFVREQPGACCITLTLSDLEKAMFLNCLALESYVTEHVSVVIGLCA